MNVPPKPDAPRKGLRPSTESEKKSGQVLLPDGSNGGKAGRHSLADRERLYSFFMHAPAAIAVLSGPDLVFELANPDYHKLQGMRRDIVGRPLLEVLPHVEPALLRAIRRAAFHGERFVAHEIPLLRDWDGTGTAYTKYLDLTYEPLFDEARRPDGLIIFANDVTGRVLAQQKVAESERRLQAMAASMPHKVFTTTPDGKLDYMSPQWEAYTGLPTKRLMKEADVWKSVLHPEDVEHTYRAWDEAMASRRPVEFESRFRDRRGNYRWHISRLTPIYSSEDNLVMWVGSNTDVDDLKRTYQKQQELETKTVMLTEQREQLMELNQAKDEFISLASHQLRTPATGVKQYLGMLLQGYVGDLTDDQKAFLRTAYESNERQITIVNDLLQVAQVDAGKVRLQKGRTDLVRMVGCILAELDATFKERDQKVTFDPPMKRLTVWADEDRLRMVLENIIDNASKYTQPHKPITVRLAATPGQVTVAVKDRGVGMDPSSVDRIFDKFSRLDNPLSAASEGSGLGLYWAKKIIDLHQGTIRVRSELGKGTTFTVVLPVRE